MRDKIIVLDFGSQYAHLIAKRLRALGYYSEIALPSVDEKSLGRVRGIVLSGGPSSVYADDVPEFNERLLGLGVPVLGLCYGHHLMAKCCGGSVGRADVGEFGIARLSLNGPGVCSPLFEGVSAETQVWMSHQDAVFVPGEGFEVVGTTADCRFAALQNLEKRMFSLQCHCEVKDTPEGNKIFGNFAKICGMERNWDEDTVLQTILDGIRAKAEGRNVLLFLSGGVDSTVAFALLNRALGQERVLGLHIDNGFMRKGESAAVAEAYRKAGFSNFIVEDASEGFLAAVAGLTDPQAKRRAVGEHFIAVRNEVVARQHLDESKWLLAQGTLYPDIIESGGTKNSHVIKTHHNRVDGIQRLIEAGLVVEPLRDLYKDEVRKIGRKIGLSDALVMRHPFPGPGLSINVLCSDGVPPDAAELEAAQGELDAVEITQFCEDCASSMRRSVLPVRSVGVQGDFRTYRFPAALTFRDEGGGFFHVPKVRDKVEAASSAITNSATLLNRTVISLYRNPSAGELRVMEGYCDRRRLDQLREVDAIVLAELHETGLYGEIFQHLTISLPFAGGEGRASFVLRPVVSEDVMTARFAWFPPDVLGRITRKIAALPFVDALYYDATNKPPATFGWE